MFAVKTFALFLELFQCFCFLFREFDDLQSPSVFVRGHYLASSWSDYPLPSLSHCCSCFNLYFQLYLSKLQQQESWLRIRLLGTAICQADTLAQRTVCLWQNGPCHTMKGSLTESVRSGPIKTSWVARFPCFLHLGDGYNARLGLKQLITLLVSASSTKWAPLVPISPSTNRYMKDECRETPKLLSCWHISLALHVGCRMSKWNLFTHLFIYLDW